MTIGGEDIIFDAVISLREIVTLVSAKWPDCVVDNFDSEMFIFETIDWRSNWNEFGATDENSNTMVQIIQGKGQLTIVIDKIDHPFVKYLAEAIKLHKLKN